MALISDNIKKQVLLHAPIKLVWRAVSDSKEFGSWFGVRFEGPFAAGMPLVGKTVPTNVDPDIAEKQKPYEGSRFEITVDRIEPMRLFSFRWHPYAVDPKADYSKEPTTLIVFELEETQIGTLLTITESGFNGIPLERRAKAFEMDNMGWEAQISLIGKYLVKRGNKIEE